MKVVILVCVFFVLRVVLIECVFLFSCLMNVCLGCECISCFV